mgnify:FL=1|jgi:hypothetical protein|tara:strand:+ start:10 stop:315 length:306 start_codon:yes stop_codon:yes gene_type:complete
MPKNSIDHCKDCGVLLKNTKHERLEPKVCSMCRGEYQSCNTGVREIYKLAQLNPTEPAEDEMWFDDIGKKAKAKAEMEDEIGRINKTTSMEARETTLSDVM